MTSPRFTVILRTFNRPEMLRHAIESVLAQTTPDWELLIADDCGPETTSAVIEEYAGRDPRIQHVRREQEFGNVTGPTNDCLARARGEFVTWLDDDNRDCPHKLEFLADLLEANPEAGFVYGRSRALNDKGVVGEVLRQGWPRPDEFDRDALYSANFIDSAEAMFRRTLFDEVGWLDERMVTMEDRDFFLRASLARPVVSSDEVVALYGLHGQNRVQQTLHLNPLAEQIIAQKRFLEGKRYRVVVVPPVGGPDEVCASHRRMMASLGRALLSLPWVDARAVEKPEDTLPLADLFRPNLVLYFYPARSALESLHWLSQRPYPSLGLCVEDPYAFGMNLMRFRSFEWWATNEASCLPLYRQGGHQRAFLMPTLSADHTVHHPTPDPEWACDLAIVGHPYSERQEAARALLPLAKEGKRILLAGSGWGQFFGDPFWVVGRDIDDREYAAVCTEAKAVVIVHRRWDGYPAAETPARGFIEGACGAVMLWGPGRKLTERWWGNEICPWETLDELRQLANGATELFKAGFMSRGAVERAEQYTHQRRLTRLFNHLRAYRVEDIP